MLPMFEAGAVREHSEIWCVFLKRHVNNAYEADFFWSNDIV